MPTVRIVVACGDAPSGRRPVLSTLVAASPSEVRDGCHREEAIRRAGILGYAGPFRIIAERAVSFGPTDPRPVLRSRRPW